ncbi:MAG TPA: ROK family protein [Terracidiphilus sp.]|jgi:glucokinase|nr:ROK family protein [Terracidiphilus sp.]
MSSLGHRTVLVYDVGGSHISAATCAEDNLTLSSIAKASQPENGSVDAFLDLLFRLAAEATPKLDSVAGASFAMPGPFDYAEGVSWMKHKLPYLYGVSLRHAFAQRLGWDDGQVRFLNDAGAYLLGEIGAGAARGVERVAGFTLGTGIGSGFAIDGQLQFSGKGVPPGGEIWNVPFEGGIVEDLISTRSIKQRFLERTGKELEVAEIAAQAAHGSAAAEVFQDFGRDLGRVLRIQLAAFAPQVAVLGGGIAQSAHLFLPAAKNELQGVALELRIAELGDKAPLVGAGAAWFRSKDARRTESAIATS